MLTKKQNLLETIRGGSPDRFVNQYEAFSFMTGDPVASRDKRPVKGGEPVRDIWGVTYAYPVNSPGAFPVHDEEHLVIKDFDNWKKYVQVPSLDYPEEEWLACRKRQDEKIDRNETFATALVMPGVFEKAHSMMGMEECMIRLCTDPDEMKEFLNLIADWEIEYAKLICRYLEPEAVFHHDDWGSQYSSFMSPAMFQEFIVPVYKRIYGTFRENGVQLVAHHSDSWCMNLVPDMIDIGIDIWQGVISTNDIPALIEQYGGKISFMGGVDSLLVDVEDWSPEKIAAQVRKACGKNGRLYYIPSITVGGPGCVYPGVYQAISEQIEKLNKEQGYITIR